MLAKGLAAASESPRRDCRWDRAVMTLVTVVIIAPVLCQLVCVHTDLNYPCECARSMYKLSDKTS